MSESPPSTPNLFIVGQPKSGTSAMHAMLAQHPQVFMSVEKEPHHFATDFTSPDHAGVFRSRSDADYLGLFRGSEGHDIIGESSTNYLFSEAAAENIYEASPGARIIAVFREPVAYLRAFHQQVLRAERDIVGLSESFETVMHEEMARADGRLPRRSGTALADSVSLQRVTYGRQLARYTSRFPREQVLPLLYDDWRAGNRAVLCRVCRFLGIDDSVDFRFERMNVSTAVRSRRGLNLVRRVTEGDGVAGAARAVVKTFTPTGVRKRVAAAAYRRVLGDMPEVPLGLHELLKTRFLPEVDALADVLGRDLRKLWGYG